MNNLIPLIVFISYALVLTLSKQSFRFFVLFFFRFLFCFGFSLFFLKNFLSALLFIQLFYRLQWGWGLRLTYININQFPFYIDHPPPPPLEKGFSSASLPQSSSTRICAILGEND